MSLFGDEITDDPIEEDFAPVVDAGDKLALPQQTEHCFGHDTQEKLFLELFEQDKMPHAMIFSGPKGIGKSTMAFRLARFLLKYGVDTAEVGLFGGDDIKREFDSLHVPSYDPVFSRVTSGGHADFLYLERFYDSSKGKRDANLKVEALRKIEPFLRKTSSAGGWRVVIIDDADTMNRNAQNALLKILEEPPSKVLIILVAHRPGMLIPTIHSRARKIIFDRLPRNILTDLLTGQGLNLSMDEWETLYALSEGSVGQALRYAEEGGIETFQKITEHLQGWPNISWPKIHVLANSLGAAAQDREYRIFGQLLLYATEQIAKSKARDEALPAFLSGNVFQQMVQQKSLEQLVAQYDHLAEHFATTEFSNLDRRDAVRESFRVLSQ
ncbi:MAG: DNA polymerase III subunit delta' [Alphaproteobacteria bacterium]|nr:DNA polymerase III subunit delta' [Alphaproteobacteria bacterium]